MNNHVLWTSTDAGRPQSICDMNGDVVLSQCKHCGRAETQLDEPCDVNDQLTKLHTTAKTLMPDVPFVFRERQDVRDFHEKFKIPMASAPSLLSPELFRFRANFLLEEVMEFTQAHNAMDLAEAADALVDLAYVLHGTALIMGLPWPEIWKAVHEKNMLKERVIRLDQSKRLSSYDVVKPMGWCPPNHRLVIGEGPWPIFKP